VAVVPMLQASHVVGKFMAQNPFSAAPGRKVDRAS